MLTKVATRRGFCVRGRAVNVLLGALIILIWGGRGAHGQPGFLSIDCGASSPYKDSSGISWSTDGDYIRAGKNVEIEASGADLGLERTQISRQMFSARVLTESSWTKFCYVLPLQTLSLYLIRLRFLAGNLIPTNSSSISFEITAGSYSWGSLFFTATNSLSQQLVEFVIVTPPASNLSLCLIPKSGTPFISSLEARLLPDTSYQSVTSPQAVYSLIHRWSCGASPSASPVRYPDDPYDRIYYLPPAMYNFTSVSNTTFTYDPRATPVLNAPPIATLQTAWVASRGEAIDITLPGADLQDSFIAYLYFAELQSLEQGVQREVIGTLRRNVSMGQVSVSPSAPSVLFNVTNSIDDFDVSVSAARTSTLGPILNVFEAHEIQSFINYVTSAADAHAITGIQASLNLTDWMGDPCLPVPWEWVNCSSPVDTTPLTITAIDLSNFNLSGSIPESISQLTALQALNLQNNHLRGPIPKSLSSLPDLVVLHLDNNELTGEVPDGLLLKQQSNVLTFSADGNVGLCYGANTSCFSPGGGHKSKTKTSSVGIIAGVLGGIVAVIALLLVLLFLYRKRTPKTSHKDGSVALTDQPRGRRFALEEVKTATNNFQQLIGRGESGDFFYGKLPNGEELAVKRVFATNSQPTSDMSAKDGQTTSDLPAKDGQVTHELSTKDRKAGVEFLNEVELLSRVHHQNLLSLVGYCDEGGCRILIYPFISGGTLREHLEVEKKPLKWRSRLDIAINSARGLEHLHNSCSPPILHRDVKSSNILLTRGLLAKVTDFGVSKITTENGKVLETSTGVKGTIGYLDPEYVTGGTLTAKTDVYCFGSVLLELVTGKKSLDKIQSEDKALTLQEWARDAMRASDLRTILDPHLQQELGVGNLESVEKVVELALESLQPEGSKRPDMHAICEGLSQAIALESGHSPSMDGIHSPRLVSSASLKRYQRMDSSSSKRNVGLFFTSR